MSRKKSGKNNKTVTGIIIALAVFLILGIAGVGDESVNTAVTTENSLSTSNVYSSDDFTLGQTETDVETKDETEGITNKTESSTQAQKYNKKPSASGNCKVKLGSIPAFSDKAYITINNNIPGLSLSDRESAYFEKYSPLDDYGRCGVVVACLGRETMPTEERGPIGSVKPSGWHTVKYDFVDGRYLYNRCHLIGFQLSGENANTRNLITGTRYMNVQGMLPFENMVADYIKETDNHVLYRVTPVFKGDELVARGVQIEAYSVEDDGDGICFNVYCYNNQPGVIINYATGSSELDFSMETTEKQTTENYTTKEETTEKPTQLPETQVQAVENDEQIVWLPKKGKCYHSKSTCSGMKEATKSTLSDAVALGYRKCSRCY